MESPLTPEQVGRIRLSLQAGTFLQEEHLQYLTAEGVERPVAEAAVAAVALEYQTELFHKKLHGEKPVGRNGIATTLLVIIGLAGPMIKVTSLQWYTLASLAAALASYVAWPARPWAAVTAAITFNISIYLFCSVYFSNRSPILLVEMLIPVVIAATPSLFVFWAVATMLYRKD